MRHRYSDFWNRKQIANVTDPHGISGKCYQFGCADDGRGLLSDSSWTYVLGSDKWRSIGSAPIRFRIGFDKFCLLVGLCRFEAVQPIRPRGSHHDLPRDRTKYDDGTSPTCVHIRCSDSDF